MDLVYDHPDDNGFAYFKRPGDRGRRGPSVLINEEFQTVVLGGQVPPRVRLLTHRSTMSAGTVIELFHDHHKRCDYFKRSEDVGQERGPSVLVNKTFVKKYLRGSTPGAVVLEW